MASGTSAAPGSGAAHHLTLGGLQPALLGPIADFVESYLSNKKHRIRIVKSEIAFLPYIKADSEYRAMKQYTLRSTLESDNITVARINDIVKEELQRCLNIPSDAVIFNVTITLEGMTGERARERMVSEESKPFSYSSKCLVPPSRYDEESPSGDEGDEGDEGDMKSSSGA